MAAARRPPVATVASVLRALYVDLDGTLLGPRGSLFRASDGGFSMDGARVLQACDRAGRRGRDLHRPRRSAEWTS